jgi:ankyrin repeat protein
MDSDADVRPLQFDRKLNPDVAAVMAEELMRRVPELPSTLSPTAAIPDLPGKMRVIVEALRMMADPTWKRDFEVRLRQRDIDVGGIDPAFVRELLGKPECLPIAGLLIDRGADLNALNESGASPLYDAAGMGDLGMVELLLARGADPNLAGKDRYPPLETAIGFRRLDVAELLYKAGVEVNPPGVDLLNVAAGLGGGGEAFVRWLLERGARLDRTDTSFAPALIIAAQTGNVETVQLLLDYGADVNTRIEEDGRTALHVAAASGWPDIVRALLEHGADVGALDVSGRSVLDAARDAEGAEDVVAILERR